MAINQFAFDRLVFTTSSAYPNQPSGSVAVTDIAFYSFTENTWTGVSASCSLVSDTTAPQSPPQVCRVLFPSGMIGGDAPGLMNFYDNSIASKNYTTVYVSYQIKFDVNWCGHASSVNKILHFFISGSNRFIMSAYGSGSQPLSASVFTQQAFWDGTSPSFGWNMHPNLVPNATFSRGAWDRVELIVRSNSGSTYNGSVDWWLNGIKVGSYSGLGIIQTGSSTVHWTSVNWSPTWGGTGAAVPVDQYMYMDHIYVSGK